MLIIFDLDDTLIDTTGYVTPFKMKECFDELVFQGVKLEGSTYSDLIQKNQKSLKSKDAIIAFAKSYGANESQIDAALKKLTTPLPPSFQVPMTPHASEILEHYKNRYNLAIVTGGHPPFQMDKLKKAGIDTSFFSMIGIPEDSVKKPYYQALKEKLNISPQEIWVCGDRIEMDLKPAFELGFNTIHMRWGRGLQSKTEDWINHSIQNLKELKGIL